MWVGDFLFGVTCEICWMLQYHQPLFPLVPRLTQDTLLQDPGKRPWPTRPIHHDSVTSSSICLKNPSESWYSETWDFLLLTTSLKPWKMPRLLNGTLSANWNRHKFTDTGSSAAPYFQIHAQSSKKSVRSPHLIDKSLRAVPDELVTLLMNSKTRAGRVW